MEESAFISFITPLQERLFRVAKRLLVSSQEAQDAVGEVTLKLWDKRDSLTSVQNLDAYAMTMTKNFCLDRLKSKQGNHLRLVHVNYEKPTDSLSESIEHRNSFSIVEKAMEPTALRVALSRARKTLKENLVKHHAYGLTKN